MRFYFSHILPLFTALFFCACAEKYDSDIIVPSESEYISFKASFVDDIATKGKPVTELSGYAGVYGFTYTSSSASESLFDMLTNKEYVFSGDELSTPSNVEPVPWSSVPSGASKLVIYSYAPLPDSNTNGFFSLSHSGNSAPVISYTVPEDITSQLDIIADTVHVPANLRSSIPLAYNHIFTAIRFKLGFGASKINSVTVKGVHNSGKYTIGTGWSDVATVTTSSSNEYTISFGTEGSAISNGSFIGSDEFTLMMIPQEVPKGATVTISYKDNNGTSQTLVKDIGGKKWESGKQIIYTLKDSNPTYIYFDLALGNVTINGIGYSGSVYDQTTSNIKEIAGPHNSENVYYVYQSTQANRINTGYMADGSYAVPEYNPVKVGTVLWRDYITNNKSVEDVIVQWDNKAGADDNGAGAEGAVRDAGRESTKNTIAVSGAVGTCNLIIDNLYSSYQARSVSRITGGISFMPDQETANHKLVITTRGDNRFGAIHYNGRVSTHKLVFEGNGSLTVADADYVTAFNINSESYIGEPYETDLTFTSNHWCSAIGNNDSHDVCYGITINSGTIFAGTTRADNSSAIGGGGNGRGQVIINGGTVTAVASTTGTAIGGGIGFNSTGGYGDVSISGGNVYAYNFANRWDIPSAAIGGAGSNKSVGGGGTVAILGGNVYAEAALGTAIGAGSSKTVNGGDAIITISGGKVVAKSVSAESGLNKGAILPGGSGIGGGTGGSSTNVEDNGGTGANGGKATITITGGIVRTGSIGGGKTNNDNGNIGSANITVSGGDIQAQFVMAAGAMSTPTFNMTGGKIRNSNVKDSEYIHIVENGGAVYLEDGTFTMSGGTIENCRAEQGGAVYIKGVNNPSFTMTGGTIQKCLAVGGSGTLANGGAIYLEGGNVTINGTAVVTNNIADGGNGGGVYVSEGNFTMGGNAKINSNTSFANSGGDGGNGGAIYVTSEYKGVDVKILLGEIIGNSSDKRGGALAVSMPSGSAVAAGVYIGTKDAASYINPNISDNKTILEGGGLYVSGKNSQITFYDGKLKDNFTYGYVANPDVANVDGMVTLLGGDIESVTVKFDGNNGVLQDNGVQNTVVTRTIVTATNNIVTAPGCNRSGYTFKGWNTRADGKGTYYTFGTNNQKIMNIDSDLVLYAQWE